MSARGKGRRNPLRQGGFNMASKLSGGRHLRLIFAYIGQVSNWQNAQKIVRFLIQTIDNKKRVAT
jgi:hypothetical protein